MNFLLSKENSLSNCPVVYPKISRTAVRHVLPFATIYLRKTTFSHLAHVKKQIQELNVEPDQQLKLSSFDPNMRKLAFQKLHQPSH
jgi:hypothetical protein